MEKNIAGLETVIFFCEQLDLNQDKNRRILEKELGSGIRFFPLPCSGRIEPLHLMRAIESGADKVYLITCPEGSCRYREGNLRAGKRLAFAQDLIEEIGLERERLELISTTDSAQMTIEQRVRELLSRKVVLCPNPLKNKMEHKDKSVHGKRTL